MPKPDVSAERKTQILAAASNIFLKKGFDATYGRNRRRRRVEHWRRVLVLQEQRRSHPGPDGLHHQHGPRRSARPARRAGDGRRTARGLHPRQRPSGGEALAALLRFLRPGRTRPPRPQPPASVLSRLPPGHCSLAGPGVARGEFRPLDVERLAILFAALYEGMLEMAMLDPENVQAVSELANALDVLFLGLRP